MISLVRIISSKFDSINRRLVKFYRMGNDDVQETLTASSVGDDSAPIKNMRAVYAKTSQIGVPVVIGYINENQLAQPGEKRIFSVDENGILQTYIYLKNNGDIEIGGNNDNMVRYSKLESEFNELKSKFNSFVTSYNTHVHSNNGVPTTSTAAQSNANITLCKIDKIKTI